MVTILKRALSGRNMSEVAGFSLRILCLCLALWCAGALASSVYAQEQKVIVTTNQQYQNMARNASFESWSGGANVIPDAWTGVNGPSYTKLTSDKMIGANSLKVTASAAGQGVSQTVTVDQNNTYTVSFYYKVDTSGSATFNVSGIGALVNQTSLNSTSWKRMGYSFDTGASDVSIIIKMTANGVYSFYIDGVMLTKGPQVPGFMDYSLTDTGNQTIYGDFTAIGNVQLGDASADTVTIKGTVVGASPALLVNQTTAEVIADFQDNETSVFTINDGGDITSAGNFTMGDGKWIGSGAASGRVIFDSTTPDVSIMGANVGIGSTVPGQKLDVAGGAIRTDNQLISTIATGTAPLAVTSTTKVTNLNADTVDGLNPGSASGIATLDASSLVVQNPANATSTATASKIPIADGSGKLDTWTTLGASIQTDEIDNSHVTYSKIQNISATDKLLGRSTAGAGVIEEIPLTSAGRALIDDADATAQRTTLGLGTLAVENANAVPAITMAADIAMGSYKITSLQEPASDQDATTKYYVDNAIAGLSWKEAVIDKDLTAPPGSPAENNRYLIASSSATGAWLTKENNYARYHNNAWVYETPEEGDAVFIEDEKVAYTWNGTSWVAFTGASAYVWGIGLTNTGTTINIDTTETADLSTAQTLTNKTLSTGTVLPADYYLSTYVNEGQADSVTSAMITNGTIVTADIAADTILAGNIAAGAVGTSEIADGTVSSTDIADSTIANIDLASGSFSNITGVGTLGSLAVKGNLNTALTGTVSVTAGQASVTGIGTAFNTELAVGDSIKISSEIFTVATIPGATSLTLDSNHTAGASGVTAYKDSSLFLVQNGYGVAKLTLDKSGVLTLNSTKITGLTDPVSASDAVTKNYVDNALGGGGTPGTATFSALTVTDQTDLKGDLLDTTGNLTINDAVDVSGSLAVGTDKLYVNTATGNVGIGTTLPAQKLDVAGTAKITGFQLGTSTTSGYVLTADTLGVGTWQAAAGGGGGWTDGGTNVYVTTTTDNVGIGTTSPGSKLEVNGDISVPAGNKINVEGSSGNSYMAYESSTNRLNVYVNGEVVAYFKN